MPKSYPPKFKFQIVLELLRGEQSVGQLASSYNVHPNSILRWKRELLEKGPEVFARDSNAAEYEARIAQLEQLLGKKRGRDTGGWVLSCSDGDVAAGIDPLVRGAGRSLENRAAGAWIRSQAGIGLGNGLLQAARFSPRFADHDLRQRGRHLCRHQVESVFLDGLLVAESVR